LSDKVRIIPLGGLGQIGKNMMVVEYGGSLLVIDAGLMFPENDMFGVDIVIPDMKYVLDRKDRITAIIITHGHEDHVGALPYLLSQVKAPVYATRLTLGLIEVKLRESHVNDVEFHEVIPGEALALGPFRVDFFRVSHSIPDGVGLAIETPVGMIVHSGDFKFDHSPVDGRPTDYAKLTELGRRGVLLLLSDSTNAETPGYTPSETMVAQTFEDIFARAQGRVIVATFASNISRIQQAIEVAHKHGRRVTIAGRSMSNNVRMAMELGYLRVPDGALAAVDEIRSMPDEQVAIVCTGSQGEPTSALVRMARNDYAPITLIPGDTVVVSSTPIPGNEEMINRTLNNLFRLGADVYYDELLDVHVSGHASQEELKMMLNIIQPRFFLPIHGEYRHLVLHARLAEQVGVPRQNVFVLESGQVLEITTNSAQVVDRVAEDDVLVDGLGVGDIGETVLEDRRMLSRNGVLIISLVVDRDTHKIVSGPQMLSRGFVYDREATQLLDGARNEVLRVVAEWQNHEDLSAQIRAALGHYIYREIRRRPLVAVMVAEL
jgi:ribonuclease J